MGGYYGSIPYKCHFESLLFQFQFLSPTGNAMEDSLEGLANSECTGSFGNKPDLGWMKGRTDHLVIDQSHWE